jgi:type IV pilus assembly protein PilE
MAKPKHYAHSGSFSKGLTLVELLVALTIIGILTAIAYPSYLDQVRKSRRAVAKSALLDSANRQEQYFFAHRAYANALNQLPGLTSYPETILFDKTGSPTPTPADAVYAVNEAATDDNSCGRAPCFKLQAVPQNDQANDSCGTFTLQSDGAKETIPATSSCW